MKFQKILILYLTGLSCTFSIMSMKNTTIIPSDWKYLSVLNINKMNKEQILLFGDHYNQKENQAELYEHNTADTINNKMKELIRRAVDIDDLIFSDKNTKVITTAQLIHLNLKIKPTQKKDILPPGYKNAQSKRQLCTGAGFTVIIGLSAFFIYKLYKEKNKVDPLYYYGHLK